MMKYVESGEGYSHSVGYEYDKLNNLTSLVETINGVKHTTTYAYDDDNRTTSVTVDGVTVEYAYDGFGRSNQQTTKRGDTTVITDTFVFTDKSGTETSAQVSGQSIAINGQTLNYTYTYDDNGNILSVTTEGKTTSYEYDAANQLIRENNQVMGLTQTWEYDNAGNILSNTRYNYTTGSLEGITPTATNTYAYNDEAWGDLLTSYNGQAITYDEIGNPASIGGRSFTWQHGRQLATQTYNGSTWTYSYNNAGLRTSRTNGAKTYRYVYNGDKLTQMTIVDEATNAEQVMYYAYDANGQLLSLTYGEDVYYYILNLQGDVVGITDSEGTRLISYRYEAYGSGVYVSHDVEKAALLAQISPFGYRSYVMDTGTAMYYLQSRYYDPTLGRFLNADSYLSTGQEILGNNTFSYCGNNPVKRTDESGDSWKSFWTNVTNTVKSWITKQKDKASKKGNGTITAGYTLNAALGVAGSLSWGTSIDRKGNIGISGTANLGGGFPSAGISNFVTITNAPSVDKLRGGGAVTGGSVSVGVASAGAEYNIIVDSEKDKAYHGGTFCVGVGASAIPVELHGEYGITGVAYFNIYDIALIVVDWISPEED